MITPGRLLWLLRRDLKRGFSASWHHYTTLAKITDYRCPTYPGPVQNVPIHLLTGEEQWLMTAWMLASFHKTTECNWRVVIHDDGTLSATAQETLKRIFPNLEIITRVESDARIKTELAQRPKCAEYRVMHPLSLKIFDIPTFCESPKVLLLDSDILFFRKPQEILDWCDETTDGSWFNQDAKEGALISKTDAKAKLDVDLWPRLNSGLCLVETATLDLDFCEHCLATTDILKGFFWRIEQTLIALCASRAKRGGLLPPTYEVSLGQWATASDLIARHYVGGVRDRFYGEGLAQLSTSILSQSDKS